MQAFIKTLFEIVALRKGPDAIPYSWLLLNVATAMWFLPLLALVAVVRDFGGSAVTVLVASWGLSLACYAAVIVLAGYRNRLLQSLTAIVGCGAIIFFAQVVSLVAASLLLGAAVAEIVVDLLLFWSVYVKGHIVARAISRQWYVGLVIAIAVFLLQYAFTKAAVTAP
ncbi:MAG TPA: hypothetical protein VLS87_03470 [Woeseiaceae bacterium]|nr:hypothetical protein [Woeseiaceae bacterium]